MKLYLLSFALLILFSAPVAVAQSQQQQYQNQPRPTEPRATEQRHQQGSQGEQRVGQGEEVQDSVFYDDDVIEERRARFGQADREFVAVESPGDPLYQGSVSFASPGGGTYSRASIRESAEHEYAAQDAPRDGARAQPGFMNDQRVNERPARQLSPTERAELADQRHQRGPGPVDELRERGATDYRRYERADQEAPPAAPAQN